MPAIAIALILLAWAPPAPGAARVEDDLGRAVQFASAPKRIVSLSPAATELICAMGAQGALIGVATDDEYFSELIGIPAVGTAAAGDIDRVLALKPDLVIVEPEASGALARLEAAGIRALALGGGGSLARGEARLRLLGRLLGRSNQAEKVLSDQAGLLATLALKTAKLERRRTAFRLIGHGGVLYAPGIGSFQNELAAAAGGLPPEGLPPGERVPLTPESLKGLKPDFLYACAKDKASIDKVLSARAWRKAAHLRDRVRYFPCALTDRAAAHVGDIAAWLSSAMYPAEYGRPENFVRESGIVSERSVNLPYPHVAAAKVYYAVQSDYEQKSFVIKFKTPQTIVSTASGAMSGVTHVGNCSSPPMVWDIQHAGGWESDLANRYKTLGLDEKTTSLLFTGADVDNMVMRTASYKDMSITAIATGGAESNAVRTSKDVGAWYQPGTINVIIVSSRALSPAGAAKALIVATEAKTAALWDLDIRSSQTPLPNPATGTGTDEIIMIAGGAGAPIDYTGTHSKIGQLIAEAVHGAVLEALAKGNGKSQGRNVFIRLRERGLDLPSLLTGPEAGPGSGPEGLGEKLQEALLDPDLAGLVETAMALDDALFMRHAGEPALKSFRDQALRAAAAVAGAPVSRLRDASDPKLPPALKAALDAVATGLAVKEGR